MAPTIDVVRMLAQAKYRYQDMAKRDISSTLSFYRNLAPKLEMYTYTDSQFHGQMKEMLTLSGTIPVNYRGTTYNIPVALYIPENYPYSPPLCYVKPTPDMTIKQSKHVDGSGRIYLPYLSDWTQGSSDLLGVIQVMICIFGETPPVYQRPKNQINQPFSSGPDTPSSSTPYPTQGLCILSSDSFLTLYLIQLEDFHRYLEWDPHHRFQRLEPRHILLQDIQGIQVILVIHHKQPLPHQHQEVLQDIRRHQHPIL